MAAPCLFLGLLLAVGSNAVKAPSSQCAYLEHYFRIATNGLLPSLLPSSISSKCLTEFNANDDSTFCRAECQSLYTTYSQCTPFYAKQSTLQCGQFQGSHCPNFYNAPFSDFNLIHSTCSDSSNCSPSCASSIESVETSKGCCSDDLLNGPKVLCGQQPIAQCPSLLNTATSAPSSECAYISTYLAIGGGISKLASLTPSLSSVCRSTLAKYGSGTDSCIPACQSLYDLLERCYGVPTANRYSTLYCGAFNKQNCSSLYTNSSLSLAVSRSCSNATYCSPECLAAITALEQHGGCCYALDLNGPKVLCGQQPIPYCSTIINTDSASGGSAAIGFNALLILSTALLTVPT
eukprot:Em0015g332a